MGKQALNSVPRRSFLTRLSAGSAAFGAAFAAGTAANAQTPSGRGFQPSMHSEDDWMDALPGVHRFLLDNTTFQGFRDAMLYANNFIDVNQNAYGVENSDLAVIVVARHFSTPFSFNDAMWEKYGETLASQSNFAGPESDAAPAPRVNPLGGSGASALRGVTLDTLFRKGLQLAVCQVATRAFAGGVARAVGAETDAIYDEITANLVENANLTPAGIVAVNRAQERGYTFAFVG